MDDSGLDELLDDALEGFGAPSEAPQHVTVPARSAEPTPPSAAPSRPKRSSFDPLGKAGRKREAAAAPTPAAAEPVAAGKAPADAAPQELDEMVDGLASLLAELASTSGNTAEEGSAVRGRAATQAAPKGDAASQQRFAATLQRMAAATPAAAPDGSGSSGGGEEGDVLEGLEGLMAQLGAGGAPGEAAEGVDGFVQNMMASLLSKEVLYQSLKEIGEKYPPWLAVHAAMVDPDDRRRYEAQHECNARICRHFEEHGDTRFQELMALLEEMQKLGQPPQDIVDMMHPGGDAGADGALPVFPGGAATGCPMQ